MTQALLDRVDEYIRSHGAAAGMVATSVPGVFVATADAPGGLVHDMSRPLLALVLQGRKQVSLGARRLEFGAGDSLLVTADVPTVSQVVQASAAAPYRSFVMELDAGLIAELAGGMAPEAGEDGAALRAGPTDADVADAALRLMRLLERPAVMSVLLAPVVRELHAWLLVGRHGAAVRRLGWAEGAARRIAGAVEVLRADYARPIRVGRLAAAAGMSPSAFHKHFRAVTSLSPLQFQKQLRLIEARRLMASEALGAASAAYAVGYESASQFSRDHARLFGDPPGRSLTATRARTSGGARQLARAS